MPSPRPSAAVQRSRTRIPPDVKTRFFWLVFDPSGPRLPAQAAAAAVGISRSSAKRLITGVAQSPGVDARRVGAELPRPKTWAQLSTDAQEALRDINVHREIFWARRRQVWVYDAAMRIVDALADTTQRTFIDLNVFPGAGKTTLGLDIGSWLLSGGGLCDPAFGRALRLMYGSQGLRVSTHTVRRLRGLLDLRRPFYDKDQQRYATHVLAREYGRFRPLAAIGEETLWASDQFVVAQLEDIDLYEREPTVQAASRESGFLSERVNVAWWDDIATTANSKTPRIAEELDWWFETEAESRVEPAGVGVLCGHRLGPLDLHSKRHAARIREDDGSERQLYVRIVYPAHHDRLCDGEHRQWDGGEALGAGCMTDIDRLPVTDWNAVRAKPNYRSLYQQEDADPSQVLVQPAWIHGGADLEGFDAPGCLDTDRPFGEHPPQEVGKLVDYVAVDPSVSNWWALEWWAYQSASRFNYLIWGERRRMQAGDLLDWNNAEQVFTGLMEELQAASVLAGHAIRVWVIEANAAHKYLFQYEHYRRWRRRWPDVAVIAHETMRNKLDAELGIQGTLPMRYRTGFKRLPWEAGSGPVGRNFIRQFIKELTHYPFSDTNDTVLSDWMGEFNLPRIVAAARRAPGVPVLADARFAPYLERQQHAIPMAQAEA